MRSRSSVVGVAAAALTVGVATGRAAVYYVATNGNDEASGAFEAPWRTPQKAAQTLVAGDTVYVRGGVYTGEVVPENSGSSNRWITYAAYSNETPTLDGQGVAPEWFWGGVFSLYERRFIRVEGFRIVRSAYAGILAEQAGDIVLRCNGTSNTWSSGIAAWNCTNVVIESNQVQWACQGDGALQECITVSGTWNFDVRGNRVSERPIETGNGGEGICIKDACRSGRVQSNVVHGLYRLGIYVDAEASTLTNVEVSANIVHDCMNGVVLASEVGGLVRDVRVFNNLLYSNRYIGIEVAQIGADGPHRDIVLCNNTVVGNGHGGSWGGGIAVSSQNPSNRNISIRNNLCSDNLNWQIGAVTTIGTNLATSHNLIDEFQGYVDGDFVEITGSSPVTGSPRFVSAAAAGYRLKPGSPAIDRGTPTGAPALDFDGRPRPADGDANGTRVVDIGAFEFTPPRFVRLTLSGAVSRLRWESVSGAVYRVQFSSRMTNPAWSNIVPDITATGMTTDAQDAAGAACTQRYYRIYPVP